MALNEILLLLVVEPGVGTCYPACEGKVSNLFDTFLLGC